MGKGSCASARLQYHGCVIVRDADSQKIQEAVRRGQMLTLSTYTYFAQERDYIDEILRHFLSAAGRHELQDKLAYCIHELANNAKKANTKRVYFQDRDLEIDNESEYWIGMENFRREALDNIDYYVPLLRRHGLYVKVQFKLNAGDLMIAIRNNVRLTALERARIEEKIRASRGFANIADAYARIEDSAEGAGLGIVMVMIMLRNLNLGEDTVRFFTNDSETYTLVTIPGGASSRAADSKLATQGSVRYR